MFVLTLNKFDFNFCIIYWFLYSRGKKRHQRQQCSFRGQVLVLLFLLEFYILREQAKWTF